MVKILRICSRLKFPVLSFLVACVLLLSGCSEKQQGNVTVQSESSASQSASMSDSLPPEENTRHKNLPIHDEKFYEDVVLNFGARWVSHGDGVSYIMPDWSSFFNGGGKDNDWKSPEEISTAVYFQWLFQRSFTLPWRLCEAEPPLTGYAIDASIFEEMVTSYFDVSIEHLRSDPKIYDAEAKEYRYGIYGGKSGYSKIEIVDIERHGEFDVIRVTLDYSDGQSTASVRMLPQKVIVIRWMEDQSYRFTQFYTDKDWAVANNEANIAQRNPALDKVKGFEQLEDSGLLAVKNYHDNMGWMEANQIGQLDRVDFHESGAYFLAVPCFTGSRVVVESLKFEGDNVVPDKILYEIQSTPKDYALIVNSSLPDNGADKQITVEYNGTREVFRFDASSLRSDEVLPRMIDNVYYTEN